MREARFIKKNVDKWNEYQHSETNDPDEMADRFVTLLDDLSYAKTFYPQSKVTRWINSIAAGIYQNIYQNKKEKYSRILQFAEPFEFCSVNLQSLKVAICIGVSRLDSFNVSLWCENPHGKN